MSKTADHRSTTLMPVSKKSSETGRGANFVCPKRPGPVFTGAGWSGGFGSISNVSADNEIAREKQGSNSAAGFSNDKFCPIKTCRKLRAELAGSRGFPAAANSTGWPVSGKSLPRLRFKVEQPGLLQANDLGGEALAKRRIFELVAQFHFEFSILHFLVRQAALALDPWWFVGERRHPFAQRFGQPSEKMDLRHRFIIDGVVNLARPAMLQR